MATRSRKEIKVYRKYLKNKDSRHCPFCELDDSSDQCIKTTKSFKVLKNIFPYSIWDSQRVEDHLMVVPKKHTDSLKDFNAEEAKEFLELLSLYEERGYNIYARAPESTVKSIFHQHTHLIKTNPFFKRMVLSVQKPFYIRLSI